MDLRKTLSFLMLLILVAEPLLASVTTFQAHKAACSTCGMKGTCGIVCCCRPHSHRDLAPAAIPNLFPAGCHRDRDSASLEFSNTPRWTPKAQWFTPPPPTRSPWIAPTPFIPGPAQEIPTPPPNPVLFP